MLDYYGSITHPIGDTDNYIVAAFRARAHESYLRNMLFALRESGEIPTTYSVSGWMVFGQGDLYHTVKCKIDSELEISQKILGFTKILCDNQLDYDVLKNIINHYINGER